MAKQSSNRGKAGAKDVADILQNPWENSYWFARMLIASDKYGGVGTDSRILLELASAIKVSLERLPQDDGTHVLLDVIKNILTKRWEHTKKLPSVSLLCDDLAQKLLTRDDFRVLALTCEKILVPINDSLREIPNDDKVFAESVAAVLLKAKGEGALSTVINVWDDVGSQGCMLAERTQVVRRFAELREYLDGTMSENELDIVLSAFCQEFERRLGQKRKGRAGRGVESVTSFILNFFKLKASQAPEHFTAGLEIDRWVRGKDGWFIGISCKRTLRERWKQAYTTDVGLLDRHKIKSLWHVFTYDRDLSDDKITEMGSHRAVLYLPDESERFKTTSRHRGLKSYVRPLSSFIVDLRRETQ